jgi:hypothetical protein
MCTNVWSAKMAWDIFFKSIAPNVATICFTLCQRISQNLRSTQKKPNICFLGNLYRAIGAQSVETFPRMSIGREYRGSLASSLSQFFPFSLRFALSFLPCHFFFFCRFFHFLFVLLCLFFHVIFSSFGTVTLHGNKAEILLHRTNLTFLCVFRTLVLDELYQRSRYRYLFFSLPQGCWSGSCWIRNYLRFRIRIWIQIRIRIQVLF